MKILSYLSVNFPVKYRNHRKLKHVKIAMALSWIVSACLWAPWILFWQFLAEAGRTVAKDNCYIQFIWDSNTMALITAAGKFLIAFVLIFSFFCFIFIIYLSSVFLLTPSFHFLSFILFCIFLFFCIFFSFFIFSFFFRFFNYF